MTANNKQVGGNHYATAIQPWDYVIANNLGYLEGTAIKYLSRFRQKGGIQDLKKAIHFIEKLIEVEQSKNPPAKTENQYHWDVEDVIKTWQKQREGYDALIGQLP